MAVTLEGRGRRGRREEGRRGMVGRTRGGGQERAGRGFTSQAVSHPMVLPPSALTHHLLSGDSWALTLHPVPPLNLRS